MSVLDQVNSRTAQVSANAKMGIQSLFLLLCKLISGLILGLTFALAGEQVFHYGPLLFAFVILTITAAFYKITKSWGGIGLLIFNLLCVLAALLIRMYVIVAPG